MKLIRSITLAGIVMSLITGNLIQAMEPTPARPLPTPPIPGMTTPWEMKTFEEKKAFIPEALRKYGFEKWRDVLKNVDVTDSNGDTALLFVSKNLRAGYTERVIDVLLALGANINYTNPKTGLKPLTAALSSTGAVGFPDENLGDYRKAQSKKSADNIKAGLEKAKAVPSAPKTISAPIPVPQVRVREKSWDEKTLDEKKALLPEALRRARFKNGKKFSRMLMSLMQMAIQLFYFLQKT